MYENNAEGNFSLYNVVNLLTGSLCFKMFLGFNNWRIASNKTFFFQIEQTIKKKNTTKKCDDTKQK